MDCRRKWWFEREEFLHQLRNDNLEAADQRAKLALGLAIDTFYRAISLIDCSMLSERNGDVQLCEEQLRESFALLGICREGTLARNLDHLELKVDSLETLRHAVEHLLNRLPHPGSRESDIRYVPILHFLALHAQQTGDLTAAEKYEREAHNILGATIGLEGGAVQ